jgi:hypothetical protein
MIFFKLINMELASRALAFPTIPFGRCRSVCLGSSGGMSSCFQGGGLSSRSFCRDAPDRIDGFLNGRERLESQKVDLEHSDSLDRLHRKLRD